MAIEVPADGGHCEDLASFCERAGVAVVEVMATLEVKDMAGLLALERDSAEAALEQMQTQEGHNASRSPQVRIAHRHDPVHTKLWPPLPLWLTASFVFTWSGFAPTGALALDSREWLGGG